MKTLLYSLLIFGFSGSAFAADLIRAQDLVPNEVRQNGDGSITVFEPLIRVGGELSALVDGSQDFVCATFDRHTVQGGGAENVTTPPTRLLAAVDPSGRLISGDEGGAWLDSVTCR